MSSLYHVLNISKQDMLSRMTDMSSVSNNLGNANTVGYKRSRVNFQEMLNSFDQNGVKIASTQNLTEQGQITNTTNNLDLAIDGDGYFAVKLKDGRIAYTRDGQFKMDLSRQLVTADGCLLQWQGTLPQGTEDAKVDAAGKVYAKVAGEWTEAGSIPLTRFANPSALLGYGKNMWLETEVSGKGKTGNPGDPNFGKLRSQAIEMSNTNIGDDLTHMLSLQRIFSMSVRAFQQTDKMISEAIAMRKG